MNEGIENTNVEPQDIEPVSDTTVSDDSSYSDVYDRLMSNNGADRGSDGKFVSPSEDDGAEDASPTDASPGGEQGADEADRETPPPDDPSAQSAPTELPGSVKAVWAELPEAARDAVRHMHEDMNRRLSDQGRELSNFKPVKDVVSEFSEYFDGTVAKYEPAEAMRYMFNLQRKMDADPIGTLMEVANAYGIANQLQQPTDATREIAALNQTIRQLQNRLENQADPGNLETAVSSVLTKREVEKAIADFATNAEFYSDVENDLPDFISLARRKMGDDADPMKVLESAYNMAVNANDDVRAKKAAAEAEREKAKAASRTDPKRTENAKKAASINVKSNGTGKQQFASDDDAMGAAYDRMMNSAA